MGMFLFAAVYIAVLFCVMAYAVALYVLGGIGLSTIARRRGIDKPWLAWVPVGNSWILGSIADDHQVKLGRKNPLLRKLLLWLSAAALGSIALYYVFYVVYVILLVTSTALNLEEAGILFVILFLLCMLALAVVMSVASMALNVLTYVCHYFLLDSCDPDKKTLYLLLGILFGPSIFAFLCRNKDLGMPGETAVLTEEA